MRGDNNGQDGDLRNKPWRTFQPGRLLKTMKLFYENNKKYLFGFLAAIFVWGLTKGLFYIFFPTPEQALPFGATDISIENHINGFLPDYSYNLSAKIKEEDFKKFIKKIGIHKYFIPDKNIYQEEDKENEWSREAYYKEGYLYYSEGKS